MKNHLFVALFVLALLTGCSSAPTSPLQQLAQLADANGQLETTLDVSKVGSANLQSQTSLGRAESIELLYKGQPIKGAKLGNFDIQIKPQTLQPGDKVRILGRIRNLKGNWVFEGIMQPEGNPGQAALLVLASNNLGGPASSNSIILTDILVSSQITTLRDMEIIMIKTPSGKPFASGVLRPSKPTNLPKGQTVEARLSGTFQADPTAIGQVVRFSGTLSLGNFEIQDLIGTVSGWE